MGRVLQLASFSFAEVTYTAGDIGYQVQESVKKASYTVEARSENVSGVVLPTFESVRAKEGNGEVAPFAVAATDHWGRLQPHRSESGWTADPKVPRYLCQGGRDAGRAGVVAGGCRRSPDLLHPLLLPLSSQTSRCYASISPLSPVCAPAHHLAVSIYPQGLC